MNIINHLFEEKYVFNLFREQVLPHYPDFKDIIKIQVKPHKQYIWEKTYHVVLEFQTTFLTNDDQENTLEIFCTAHSSEDRKNAFDALNYLWHQGFSVGNLTTPHPLFFDPALKAFFYRGASGRSLYYYIKEKKLEEIEKLIPLTAAWYAKLHQLPAQTAKNFNPENSRIKSVVPGLKTILKKIEENYPGEKEIYEKIYRILIKQEENFLASTDQRWLIHGDAHPENIIKIQEDKIAGIDFTDVCLSDFARDLGGFIQQVEYMINRKIGDQKFADKIKQLFLESYTNNAKIDLTANLQSRIDNYYNWTAVRTATFFLMKHDPQPERSELLLKIVRERLDI